MGLILFAVATFTLLLAHYCKVLRWELFINIYEKPRRNNLMQALSVGHICNFLLPFRTGEIVRAFIAGRKLKNGFAFSFATVIVERVLDIIIIGFFFLCILCMNFSKLSTSDIVGSFYVYAVLSGIFVFLGIILLKYSKYPKILMGKCASIFNQKIELSILSFFWALISSFKNMHKNIKRMPLFITTVIMWTFYLISYYLFAGYLCSIGVGVGVVEVFNMLFSSGSLELPTKNTIISIHNIVLQIIIYLCIPLVIMLVYVYVAKLFAKEKNGSADKVVAVPGDIYLIPHINAVEKRNFLVEYFTGRDRDYFALYMAINKNIAVMRDLSGGSHAVTLLAIDKEKTFFRKYAIGDSGKKLKVQADWIRNHPKLFLPKILNENGTDEYYCYDMEFNNLSSDFFGAMHSFGASKAWEIISSVLLHIENNLHSVKISCGAEYTKRYIDEKVMGNLAKIKKAKSIRNLLAFDRLKINGKTYKNLHHFVKYLSRSALFQVFSSDSFSDIHGDLTLENIIYAPFMPEEYYLIDPNSDNIHNSPFIDYAKLLQSLHMGYEFLMKVRNVQVQSNSIIYEDLKSSAYDKLYQNYKDYLSLKFSKGEIKSIYYHEIVNYLRLIPYKIEKNEEISVVFFAVLIILLNEVCGGNYEK